MNCDYVFRLNYKDGLDPEIRYIQYIWN